MNIDTLIAKYLNGESTPEENDQLNKWRKLSPENELIFQQSENTWHLAFSHQKNVYFDKERTWTGIRKSISRRYSLPALLRVTGIAASIALVLGWALNHLFTDSTQNIIAEQPQQITLYIPSGISSKTILPDSTVVWLNSCSTISYPSYFDGDTRTIELIGEAFFDVAHDGKKPFIIHSGHLKVNVVGTSFNFKHYEEDTHAVLAVETGTVTLSTGSATSTTLHAGKCATVDNHTFRTKIFSAPQTGMSTWRNHIMVFRDEPFSNVLNELARRYNVEFEIRGEEIQQYIYTATFDNLNLEDVLNLLKLSSPIDYAITRLTANTANAYGKRQIIIFQK